MTFDRDDQMIGLCFMPAQEGKPLGHAMLILPHPDDPKRSITIDYDGYKTPLIEDGRDAPLFGDVLLFRASAAQIERLHEYYHRLSIDHAAPFYFNRDLGTDGKFALRGKTSTNCLHSIVTILEEQGHIDMHFLKAISGNKCRPAQTAQRLGQTIASQNSTEHTLLYTHLDHPMGLVARDWHSHHGTDSSATGLFIKGFKGQFTSDDIWRGKLYDGFTQYFIAGVGDRVSNMQDHSMNVPSLYHSFFRSMMRQHSFITGQIAHHMRHRHFVR